MKEDWLWDRSGPPDPEIEKLERTLAPLRYRPRAPRPARTWWAAAGAAAAVIAAAAGLTVSSAPDSPETAWQVAGARVHQGQLLRTGNEAVRLEAEAVGRVDLAPNSLLRAASEKRLSLERGELHAFIWARPREFVVDTPSARAVDLGCEYTLSVDASGDGLLRVALGWVAFAVDGHESFIPADAECHTSRRGGPGIPYYQDAPAGLRSSLASFERGDSGALPAILRQARSRDGLTLWHLLTRAGGADRAAVYARLAELIPLPAGVTRNAVLRGDAAAIDECWNALGLENTGWWRGWERRWSESQ
jgi:hypothetical protein